MFDKSKMFNWDWCTVAPTSCPVGVTTYNTPEEYSRELFSLMAEFDKYKLQECLSGRFFLEAIADLHITISAELRFLLTRQIKDYADIPIDTSHTGFQMLTEMVRNMKDYQLFRFALIFGRINEIEYNQLSELNKLRNDFAHTIYNRKKYTPKQINDTIKRSMKIEERLIELVIKNTPDKKTINALKRS
jgi:hypothetical protein